MAVPESPVGAALAVPVQVGVAEQGSVPVYLDGLGTVQAFNSVTLKTRVDGEIQSILFTEGQMVNKGDLLAVVDPRTYTAAVEQASAKLQQDKANLDNANYLLAKDQKLATQNITTAEQVETQQSIVAALQAQIGQDQAAKDAASVALTYTELRAPISGRTGFRLVDEGNQVHAADSGGIVVITQTQPISVVSTLSEDDLSLVRKALASGPIQVIAFTRDGTTPLATGTLTVVDNVIDQSSGTARLKSTFANLDEALWPGQFVDVRIRQKLLADAITVPSAALQRGQKGFFVYVVNQDNIVTAQPVTPGPINNDQAVIVSGLKGGEKVVTTGQYRLASGLKISVQLPVAAPTSAKEG
ncbi:efflux transporter periplasmic adaptor subunit [Rhizobium tubonense]|uniref:Efflux transporter periplasmic adaptor subunit n=2 Tax=Rhizobium tubonense TaxID=484088 RepID=A0A2W4E6V3_9HYPH|nr:efflux transporter periplasmic adaptor subunit [Rhizobium tubonense]